MTKEEKVERFQEKNKQTQPGQIVCAVYRHQRSVKGRRGQFAGGIYNRGNAHQGRRVSRHFSCLYEICFGTTLVTEEKEKTDEDRKRRLNGTDESF